MLAGNRVRAHHGRSNRVERCPHCTYGAEFMKRIEDYWDRLAELGKPQRHEVPVMPDDLIVRGYWVCPRCTAGGILVMSPKPLTPSEWQAVRPQR